MKLTQAINNNLRRGVSIKKEKKKLICLANKKKRNIFLCFIIKAEEFLSSYLLSKNKIKYNLDKVCF